jgi:hypothetical protein
MLWIDIFLKDVLKGQQIYEKMPNITNHDRYGNQNYA